LLVLKQDGTGNALNITAGKLKLPSGGAINEFSTDGTLAGNSDDAVPTEKAVKTYVDNSGSGPSNVIFCWIGFDEKYNNEVGYLTQDDLTVGGTFTAFNSFFVVYRDTARTILRGRFTKISGISSVVIHARLWAETTESTAEAILTVTIGSATAQTSKSVESSTPTWYIGATPIDVSGLVNGTTYDITIQLNNEGYRSAQCSGVMLMGS
jgi:hypothetical protein